MNRIILLLLIFLALSSSECLADKLALLIGIGDYDTSMTGWRKIHGDNDVNLLSPLLLKHNFKVTTLVNSHATKENIVKAIKQLSDNCKPGDEVYLHFSGHGQPVIDCNSDEDRTYDQAVAPYDAFRSEGYAKTIKPYRGENHLIDDELNPLIQSIRNHIGKKGRLFIVFDACYSRGLEKGENPFPDDPEFDEVPEFMRGTTEFFNPSDNSYLRSLPLPTDFPPGCFTVVVTACRENERNFEYKAGNNYYGALSYCISLLLRKDADFTRWADYFNKNLYLSSGCFLKIQHPTIKIFK